MVGWPRLGLTQAGPGTPSPTCSPLSPGMPGTPRAPGTDCPGGPLSPCKRTYAPDVAGGSGAFLLSPVPWMCCFPCPHTLGMPVQVGMGTGMGPAQPQDKQGPIHWAGGTQGRTPKPVSWQGRDRAGTWLLMPPTPRSRQGQGHPLLMAPRGGPATCGGHSPSGPACPQDLVDQRFLGARGGQEHRHCPGDRGHR